MTQLIQLSTFRFDQLVKAHISLDEVYLLELAHKGLDLSGFEGKKIKALITGLKRKEYLKENGAISDAGIQLYQSLIRVDVNEEPIFLNYIQDKPEEFEQWWAAFPGHDGFEHKGKVFTRTRGLRVNKDSCRTKFNKILSEGITLEQMIAAIEAEVLAKKELSVVKKQNQLSYLPATEPYLNKRSFEGFLDAVVEKKEVSQIQKFM